MKRRYLLWSLLTVALYSTASWRGMDVFGPERDHIPQSIRQAPGGYRSFTYWRGGK